MHITIGVTTFRPETVPFAREAMRGCDAVFLEEPQTPGFDDMLTGDLAVDEYIMLTEFEFPDYARQTCALLRELHAAGARVYETHPWLDSLVEVQEFFAAGGEPGQVAQETPAGAVYATEKRWTGALLEFYKASRAQFRELTAAVRAFAREDAAKIREQDVWRAEALEAALVHCERPYVECGSVHHALILELMRRFPGKVRVRHLMEEVTRPRYGRRRVVPPGDVLTFLYMLDCPAQPEREDTLAARAMIYNKLIEKVELHAESGGVAHPHLENEARVIARVNTMDYAACEELWPRLRGLSTQDAQALVRGEAQ